MSTLRVAAVACVMSALLVALDLWDKRLFLSGIRLFFVGILGEYLGRIFNETKARPLYFLNAYVPSAGASGLACTLDGIRRDLAKPGARS